MLIEGECEALGPRQAAETFGFSKSRYYHIRTAFQIHGAKALASHKRGPKRQYRRTQEVTRQVIRHRFLDPDATAEVIAQKIRQTGLTISTRSVERVIEDFGLQKKQRSAKKLMQHSANGGYDRRQRHPRVGGDDHGIPLA